MKVPFLDLHAHHAPHLRDFQRAINGVIESGAFAGGPFVATFEKEFAAYLSNSAHAIGLGNGTDALWLALLAMGIGPGDEVITVPATFIATAEAISYCGATPVFVDIEEKTCTMDPARLEEAITPRTRAIIPVHLFGQPADMDPILEIARRNGLRVIEDACQAHGAEYKGRKAGSLSDAGCFSFYPGKNLGAFGEAGALVTDCEELVGKIRSLRDHGQTQKYHHAMVGWNCRMDGIQGAVLQIKLQHLDENNDRRRAHACHYDSRLAALEEVIRPSEAAYARHVYHIYAIRVQRRDALMRALASKGIDCGVHYPVPVHLQEAYRHLGHRRGDFPVTERCADEFISLPMFPELISEQVDAVVSALESALCQKFAAA